MPPRRTGRTRLSEAYQDKSTHRPAPSCNEALAMDIAQMFLSLLLHVRIPRRFVIRHPYRLVVNSR
jgi:hypothetical protein